MAVQLIATWGSGGIEVLRADSDSEVTSWESGWAAAWSAYGGQPGNIGYTVWPRDRERWDDDNEDWSEPPRNVRDALRTRARALGLLNAESRL